ncbi:SapC family protein [Sulfuritalea sp.]|uniref:SapC family protein n=1 Tax=Sulfuritalea sp. TaxID=2480090 RepID=UPI00286E40EC|nr:SapC family protein [Sulfuritalea sp.]
MATLLFYEKPVPLNVDVHLKTRLGSLGTNVGFAASTNSVPLATVEFIDTAREYPIAFTGKEGGALFPIALVGVRQNENLFVTAENRWDGRYIPAFVRRYPFVLAEKQGADDFNVYIDEAYPGFGAADGERIFTDDGEHTPLLKQALEFLGTYQGEITRTRLFVERLQSLDLLIPRVLEVVRNDEPPLVLQGFSVVDEQRLAALADADLLALARDGYLALIYAHLGSLGNVARLSEKLESRLANAIPAADAAVLESGPAAKKKRGNGKEVQAD